MTITHWDEKTRDAVFNIINLLFCCGICVEIDHTYVYEDTDEILLNFLKRQWYIGLKTGKCYMVHRTLGDHCKLVEDREDFRQISYVRLAAVKTITGHGLNGYLEAIDYLVEEILK
jgi:hypothetical protein